MANYIQISPGWAFFKLVWLVLGPINIYMLYRSNIYMAPTYEKQYIKVFESKSFPERQIELKK